MQRSSGIILPVSSLPSPYGIGTMGAAARAWVDFLGEAEQVWWQVLHVGPTSYGDSPYQSPSTFAGNPYLIDLDMLVADGLLTQQEVEAPFWGSDATRVDYGALYESRMALLSRACERGWARDAAAVEHFRALNAEWLEDYALFMAVKAHFGMKPWTEWPDEDIRLHAEEACARYRELLASDVRLNVYVQYLFFDQWEALRTYAHEHGVKIIGDLPIYVAMDSADVWGNPASFQLDEKNVPYEVAGVPPDAFTADGQLWGNPLYDWDAMASDGFAWWKRRLAGATRLYDAIRIDHFRGFESYWAVPAGETTAKSGRWVKGPGMALLGVLREAFPKTDLFAEDLGYLTPEVKQLLADSGFPGMKVLQFGFDRRDASSPSYFPHVYTPHSVCYVGTHDNAPLMEWVDEADPRDVQTACRYLGIRDPHNAGDLVWAFVRGGMSSVSDLFMMQMQDYLGLGAESRMNAPGTIGSNWQWRLRTGQATHELAARIAEATRTFGRCARS